MKEVNLSTASKHVFVPNTAAAAWTATVESTEHAHGLPKGTKIRGGPATCAFEIIDEPYLVTLHIESTRTRRHRRLWFTFL